MGKVANLESMVSGDCTFLLEHVIIIRRSCFDTDFVVQIKLTKLPLIHCFAFSRNPVIGKDSQNYVKQGMHVKLTIQAKAVFIG